MWPALQRPPGKFHKNIPGNQFQYFATHTIWKFSLETGLETSAYSLSSLFLVLILYGEDSPHVTILKAPLNPFFSMTPWFSLQSRNFHEITNDFWCCVSSSQLFYYSQNVLNTVFQKPYQSTGWCRITPYSSLCNSFINIFYYGWWFPHHNGFLPNTGLALLKVMNNKYSRIRPHLHEAGH